MHFTTIALATAIAVCATAAPSTPRVYPRSNTSEEQTLKLSLTKQLRLVDNAGEYFRLLPLNADFIFDFNQPQKEPGKGGELVAANRATFPALVGTGSGMAVGRVDACGMNTLHVHPRSAELQVVVEGRLITEMVPENGILDADGNRRSIHTELGPFQMTPFYQGSIHTQFNPDCEPAVFVASFANEDFGTLQTFEGSFAMGDDIVAAGFGQRIAGEDIERIRAAIPTSIALGVEDCLKKCNIQKRSA